MSEINKDQQKKLRRWNISAGILHLGSMIAILALSNKFALPVTASYSTGPPGTALSAPVHLFSARTAYLIALFMGLSAFFHFLVASRKFFPRYIASLNKHKNIFRWVEYSISSSVMIFVIAQLCGISDYAALLGIVGCNVSMILFGWLQEKFTTPGDGQLLPFIFGCIAGIVPWIVVVVQLLAPKNPSSVHAPGFVYGIVISLFILFNCFALVQYKQYKAKGKWANYLRGEKTYIILSFVAKSLLAWQIFSGTLIT